MADCNIDIKINGKVVFTAHSDRELDAWIAGHQELLSEGIKFGFGKIYSLNSVDETIKKLENAKIEHLKFKDEIVRGNEVPIAITTLYNNFGRARDITMPIRAIINAVKEHYLKPTDVGTEVNEVFDAALLQRTPKNISILTSEQQQKIEESTINDVLRRLQTMYDISDPKKQIFIEYGMHTKTMNEPLAKALKESTKSYKDSTNVDHLFNKVTAIDGRADIMVVDDHGIVHIFDLKTANKINNTSFLVDNNGYVAQVITYREILRQKGIPVGDTGLIVFKTDYTDDAEGLHIRLDDVSFNNIYMIPESHEYVKVVQDFFWQNTSIKEDRLSKLGTILNELFPNSGLTDQMRAKDSSLQYRMQHFIHEVDPENDKEAWDKGYRWFFYEYPEYTNRPKRHKVYGKTKAELTEDKTDENGKIIRSPYGKYTDLVNAKKARIFSNFATDLEKAMIDRDLDFFEDVVMSIAANNRDTLMHQFKRYILCNWKFKANEALNSNGIYLFEKNNRLEIVVLESNHSLKEDLKLPLGSSILGTYLKDSPLTDNRTIMEAKYGNGLLMKAMLLLSLSPELIENKKVTSIKAMNVKHSTVYEEVPSRLQASWNHLALRYNESHTDKLRMLGDNTFESDARALMDIADEYIELLGRRFPEKYSALTRSRAKDKELTREYITDRMHALQQIDKNLKDYRNQYAPNLEWSAYAYLNRCLLAIDGFSVFQEDDLHKIFNGINLTGINMRSFNSSSSPLARQMGDAMNRFRTAVRLKFVEEQREWSRLIDAAYKEEGHISGVLGNDWDFFKHWFRTKNGKLDPELKLVKPQDFKQGPAARKAYEMFLELNAKHRWPSDVEREEKRGSEEWYEVPLVAAQFEEQFLAGNPRNAMRNAWNRLKDTSIELLLGDKNLEKTRRELERIDFDSLENVVWTREGDRRMDAIEKFGIDSYSKNIDYIALSTIFSGVRAEQSPMFCEMFVAFLVAADYLGETAGLDIKDIRDAMEKYIQDKLFNRDIRDPENRPINAVLGLLKGATAKVALGWNSRAFFREILTGEKKHINRWIADADKQNKFVQGTKKYFTRPELIDYTEFVKCYADIIAKMPDNASIFGFYSQLNSIYGMVNFSGTEMIDASKRHQWTVLGLSDKSSVTATAPDFLHRMAILGGHLRTIGAWDAYSLDPNTGYLEYDMHKDLRFQTWFKYKDHEDSIPDAKTRLQYQQEKQSYQEQLDDWNGTGMHLNYGDLLPQALSPMQSLNIKTYADQQYGNYDDETKSIVQKQTLGSLFFQYKTYGLAQVALWFSDPGYTNSLSWMYVLDENGEKLVKVPVVDENELKEHGDWIEKPESQVTEEDWKRGAYYWKQVGGEWYIGKAQSAYLLGSQLFNLSGEEFAQLWNDNPTYRSNLYISLLDLFEMMLIGLLLRLFWGTDEEPIYRQDFLHRWTYGVLQGMSTDGPLFQTFQGLTGDGTPPVLGMLKNYYNTAISVINGNTEPLYAVTNTVGMTRELSNFFRSK